MKGPAGYSRLLLDFSEAGDGEGDPQYCVPLYFDRGVFVSGGSGSGDSAHPEAMDEIVWVLFDRWTKDAYDRALEKAEAGQ